MSYKVLKVGLTGGIGCGKSSVLGIFQKLEVATIDSDYICHRLYKENTEFKNNIVYRWGKKILTEDGDSIDRKKIANIVFKNQIELDWLNSILHPLILKQIYEHTEKIKRDKNIEMMIYDIPLLYEIKWERFFDYIIAVWIDKERQIKRLIKRGWDIKEIHSRLSKQMSNNIKLEKSDFGIINTGTKKLLKIQCENIYLKLRELIWQKRKK